MLCDKCKKNSANYHYTHIVNGQKTETHLCQDCLNQQTGGVADSAANMLSGLLGRSTRTVSPRCSHCGMEYSRFQQTGLLGCAHCYDDFREQLQPMLRRIHGQVQHQGHVPKSAGESLKVRRRLEALRGEMQTAVQDENFERAAELRDQIRITQEELKAIVQPKQQAPAVADDKQESETETKEGGEA